MVPSQAEVDRHRGGHVRSQCSDALGGCQSDIWVRSEESCWHVGSCSSEEVRGFAGRKRKWERGKRDEKVKDESAREEMRKDKRPKEEVAPKPQSF